LITVTDKAKVELELLIEKSGMDFLRVAVKGGGCSGFAYKLNFEEDSKENDTIFQVDKFDIIVDSKSLLYLIGCEVDFENGLMGSGFVVHNPNAKSTCGCGESFSV
tara:strand:- start:166 stop:483 length:318 start_codon:yes stop_codon:yes gene_type:complete